MSDEEIFSVELDRVRSVFGGDRQIVIVQRLMAAAWDEGFTAGAEAGGDWPRYNPYREENA